jgi:transketolase
MTKSNLVNVRSAFASALIEYAKERSDFLVLDCDSKEPTKISEIYKEHPEICISFGISEQNMVSAAAGIATTGTIAFLSTFAQFISMRALDQVRNSIAYPNLNVKLVACHYGLDVGKDGVTHQTIEDISIFRAIPNFTILNASDDIECKQMIKYCFENIGPVYLRTGKSLVPRIHNKNYKFKIGDPDIIRSGNDDISIIATGNVFEYVLKAMDELEKKNISPMLINMPTLKPINEEALLEVTKDHKIIITVEDHNIHGGLGSIISDIFASNEPKRVVKLGVNDVFAEAGETHELYEKYGFGTSSIVNAVLDNAP